MPLANVNGIELSHEVVGDGPAIAFVHGGYGGASSSVLLRDDSWVDAFSDSYTVVTYDRRSAGRSTYPESGHTLDLLVSDLRGLLTHLGISRAFVVGSSAGGPIAVTYALTYPEAVIGLILPNTSARLWRHDARVKTSEQIRRRFNLLMARGPEETFDLIQREQAGPTPMQLSSRGLGPRPPERLQALEERERKVKQLTEALRRADLVKYAMGELRNQAAYLDSDLLPRLSEIAVPTLVVHGDADTQVPYDLGRELAEGIPNAELVTMPGAGHGVMQWEAALVAIRAFCDRIDADARKG